MITGLSLVRKINILLCKPGKCIYFMPDTLFLLLFTFFFFFFFLNARLIQQVMMKLMMTLMTLALVKVILMNSWNILNITTCEYFLKMHSFFIRSRKFDLNLGRSYFFHLLSPILFLFSSYIFALSLDWATVFVKILFISC